MRWFPETWAKVPSALRTILTYVFWLPVMLIFMALIQAMIESLGLGGAVGALAQILIAAALLALTWYFLVRPSADRAHGGAEKRRANTSAIRTGVIGPEADREHLKETVRRHFAGRRYLWIFAAIGFGAMVVLPLAWVVRNPPMDSGDVFILWSQLMIFLIFFIPLLLFHRRQGRQMTALREALDADEPPPADGLPG
jgi:hypothetical protein